MKRIDATVQTDKVSAVSEAIKDKDAAGTENSGDEITVVSNVDSVMNIASKKTSYEAL